MTDIQSLVAFLAQPSNPIGAFYVINGEEYDNSIILEPLGGETIIETDITGKSEFYCEYLVAFNKVGDERLIFSEIDTHNNDNIEDYETVKKTIDWIKEKNKARDFPTNPYDWTISKIETVSKMPVFRLIDESNGIAKYTITIRVWYYGEL